MKKLLFYFPWKEVSGGPYFLCRLASETAKLGIYEVYYSDFYDGLSDKLLDDPRVRKLPYIEGNPNESLFPNEPIIVVTPIYWANRPPKMHPDSKIVFFNWHNACIPVLQKQWHINSEELDSFLRLVRDTGSVFFCDVSHWQAQNRDKIVPPEKYVPITIPVGKRTAKPEIISKRCCNVAIVGRLCTDKVFTAIDLLDNISALGLDMEVRVHVIGEGPHSKGFFSHNVADNVRVIRHGTLPRDQMIKLLENEVDILFAMGTSVLEGGAIGLPSVILPNETHFVHCNAYSYLYQSKGYMLGWGVDQLYDFGIPHTTVKDIFSDIYERGMKEEIGKLCYQYCIDNHSSNTQAFLDAVGSSSLTYAEYAGFRADVEKRLAANGGAVRSPKSTLGTSLDISVKNFSQRTMQALGTTRQQFSLFGIPIYTLTQRDAEHYNVYLLFLPLCQVNKTSDHFSIHFLVPVWIAKLCKKIHGRVQRWYTTRRNLPVSAQQLDERHQALRARIYAKLEAHEKIRVCLFESRISCWQFGKIYDLLEADGRFEPIVVVIPFMTMGQDAMVAYCEETYAVLYDRGYRVFKGFDEESGAFFDIKNELHPDAVFYSYFWKEHFEQHSYISEFEEIYSFLYPYGYDVTWFPNRMQMNFELQNKVTRYYLPTKIHKCIAEENMDNMGSNVYITGSPKLDALLDKSYQPKDVWLNKDHSKKRVIWAPHHSLSEQYPYNQLCAFLELYTFMLECAREYSEKVEFVFKPHPMLKPRLYDIWGKVATDQYFEKWEQGENVQLLDGECADLFLTSDAMILDSISFIAEYTIVDKPAFFTFSKDTRFECNKFGKALLKELYRNENTDTLKDEIKRFIEDVVINGEDYKAASRHNFISKYMLPENGSSAAQNIYEDMCRVIIDDNCEDYVVRWDNAEGGTD